MQHRIAGHQVADVAHQHEAAAGQSERAAVGRGIGAIGVEPPLDGPAALLQRRREVALHEAEPVAIDRDLVLGIDRRDRILAVHDRGDRSLQHHVGDPGRVVLADRMVAIDADLDVQAVVDQEDRRRARGIALIAGELFRLLQAGRAVLEPHRQAAVLHRKAPRLPVRALRERRNFIEEIVHEGEHLGAARGVVAGAARCTFVGDRIGAVERIIEAAPARVGGIQGVARVHDRHDELRSCDGRDLRVDVLRGRREILALGHEVADLAKEALVRLETEGPVVLVVPGVDPGLQLVAPGQERAVARCEVVDDRCQRRPEGRRVDARAGQRLVVDEVVQDPGDPKAAGLDTLGHGLGCPSWVRFHGRPSCGAPTRQPYPTICASPPSSGVVPRLSGCAWRGSRHCGPAAPGRAAASQRAARPPAPPARRSP
jgi:hypothetical protein